MHYALDMALIYQFRFYSFWFAAYLSTEFELHPHPAEALAIGYWIVRVFPVSLDPASVALLIMTWYNSRTLFALVALLVFLEGFHAFCDLPFRSLSVAWYSFTILQLPFFVALEISWQLSRLPIEWPALDDFFVVFAI